jgi:hypothetical protein
MRLRRCWPTCSADRLGKEALEDEVFEQLAEVYQDATSSPML